MRIAFVVQRYGLEVNGGAELHCRLVAEHLARRAGVEEVRVLTTCALDHATWKNHYRPGREQVAGVEVERFPVVFPRLRTAQTVLGWGAFRRPRVNLFEAPWVIAQGPFAPGLTRGIDRLASHFDAFVFFTYLYFPTVYGLPRVGERSLLVPTAHDEPALGLSIYRRVFEQAGAIAFNTPEERELVAARFSIARVPNDIVGCGVELAGSAAPKSKEFSQAAPLPRAPYILYLGRLERGKGLPDLIDGFLRFKRRYADRLLRLADREVRGEQLILVLAGRGEDVSIPKRPDIVLLGFVTDDLKRQLIENAAAVVIPSQFESLSLVLLEAWTLGRPALVNGRCAVTSGHVARSGGGTAYEGPDQFADRLASLLGEREQSVRAGAAGRRYVEEQYAWERVETRLMSLLELVARRPFGPR
jgi:glycosyltransferase involved in cell wall biosynthesis